MVQKILKEYSGKVHDLGLIDSKFSNCYSTLEDQSEVSKYVQDQFTKNADTYTKLYTNYGYFEGLIKTTLNRISYPQGKKINILDLGCGSGNTIFPLLKMFPESRIIASDLSLDLLYILKQNLSQDFKNPNIALLQLNAEKLFFSDGTFDLVVGGAILHHLFHPEKTIEGCSKILKDGGYAFFYEPFEEGNTILCYLYEAILNDSRNNGLDKRSKKFLQQMVNDYKTRIGADIEQEIFKHMDDKRLFTKSYFYDLSDEFQFSKCIIYPLHESKHQFENKTLVNLRFVDKNPGNLLPAWAWDKIRSFDEYFTDEFKKELLIEGCVIFKKA